MAWTAAPIEALSRGRKPIVEIVEQLANLDIVEVSSHGSQEGYFEPTAARCTSSMEPPQMQS